MLQGCQEVSPQPSLLAEQVQLPQSFFVALLWARSSSSMSFAGVSRPWCNSPAGESRQGQFPSSLCWLLFFWCSPGYGWPFGLQQHTAGSCQAFSKPDIPKSFSTGFFFFFFCRKEEGFRCHCFYLLVWERNPSGFLSLWQLTKP